MPEHRTGRSRFGLGCRYDLCRFPRCRGLRLTQSPWPGLPERKFFSPRRASIGPTAQYRWNISKSNGPTAFWLAILPRLIIFHRAGLPVIADYSLNAANDLAVDTLLEKGAQRITAAFDLNQSTFADMVRHADANSLEVILHGHVPMFHTAHCLYCAAYSDQNAKPQCGRPCLSRKARLRDRKGCEHPVLVDADCRNIVFHAQPQSLAEYRTWLTGLGVRHFRIELLDHTAA